MTPKEIMIYYGDLTQENTSKLIAHCDQKIDVYFAKLNKKIERLVKSEVKKYLSKKGKGNDR